MKNLIQNELNLTFGKLSVSKAPGALKVQNGRWHRGVRRAEAHIECSAQHLRWADLATYQWIQSSGIYVNTNHTG